MLPIGIGYGGQSRATISHSSESFATIDSECDLHGGNGFMSDADGLRYTKIPLNNGSDEIPALGFGTLIPDPIATKEAVRISLEVGFRQFDCAERYRNEEQVGEAMRAVFKEGKVKRKDVFVGTKLWNNNHRPERVRPAFEASLKRLHLDYVDLYSTHTPFAFKPGDEQDPRDKNGNVIYDDAVTLTNTWEALESLVDEGRCKAIGLSNVSLGQLKEVFEVARIKPAVVQVESHPYLPEWDLLDYCKRNGIVMQAFAALGHGIEPKLIDDPVITVIAKRVNKTPAQVYWPGRCSAARLLSPQLQASATSRKILISRLFPMTPSRRSLKGSVRESGSIRLLTRASRGSFPGEDERTSRNFPLTPHTYASCWISNRRGSLS